jgi:peptidoglycan/LPS O-acetylase OafA/YrhL
MRTLFALTFLAAAMASALFLLVAFVRVLRSRTVRASRSAVVLVLMILALWQSYRLNPVPAAWIAYLCVPGAIAGALLILLSGVRDLRSDEPNDGPERRVRAMAMRLPQTQDEEEELTFAAGGGRVA